MNWEKATDQQLLCIATNDKDCPPHLLEGVALEMVRRRLWDSFIVCAARIAWRNVKYVLRYIVQMDWEEMIHVGHIEIMKQVPKFRPGHRTLTTFVVMCLKTKFLKMRRDATAEKRYANIGTKDVDSLDEKLQDRIFCSPENVERTVVNRLWIESSWGVLREVEQKAILLDLAGYSQYEISEMLGFHKRHGNKLLKRAYAKLRKHMEVS